MKTTHMSVLVGISNDEKDKDHPPQDTSVVTILSNNFYFITNSASSKLERLFSFYINNY